jgi:hypothetical protein
MPDGGASLYATIASIFTASAPSAGAIAGSTAAANVAVGGMTAIEGASIVGGSAGFTFADAALAASAVAGVGGTAAQLMAEKPKIPTPTPAPVHDEAQREADLNAAFYRRRGRAAALMTPGGARGDTSSVSLGAASLLGG